MNDHSIVIVGAKRTSIDAFQSGPRRAFNSLRMLFNGENKEKLIVRIGPDVC